MSQAEKLMHELSQNCGIDFNNTRRALAVKIINRTFGEIVAASLSGGDSDVSTDHPQPLAAVPSVAEAIQSSEDTSSYVQTLEEQFVEANKESYDATGK